MALPVLSASVVTNPWIRPGCEIQAFNLLEIESFVKGRKSTSFACKLQLKQETRLVQSLAIGRSLRPTTLTFAVRNRNGEAKKDRSDVFPDDFMPPDSYGSSECPDAKMNLSNSQSQVTISQSIECRQNQGSLLDKLKAIQLHILASERWNASKIRSSERKYRVSAANLIHCLALKSLDITEVNEGLYSLGLLNLESINTNVLSNLKTTIRLLESIKSNLSQTKANSETETYSVERLNQQKETTIHSLRERVCFNREVLLGTLPEGRATHIMVTVGKEAIDNDTLIADILREGASIIRINCAHGEPGMWSEIIRRVKSSSQMLEMPCRVLMDLAGPKLRTGSLEPGPCVMKISPKKDFMGNVVSPAQVWLSCKGVSPPAHMSLDSTIFIEDKEFLAKLQVGDAVRFCDARGEKRILKISRQLHVFSSTGFVAACSRTAYVQSGTELSVRRKKGKSIVGRVVDVPAQESFLRLKVGDLLVISRDGSLNKFSVTDAAHRITCPSGYLFDAVKPGEPIAFDDGRIWGTIQGVSSSEVVVLITRAGPKGTKLGSEKSINIPQSNIRFEGLTSKDLIDLEFVASNADMVGISFVRDIRDVIVLRRELEKRKLQSLGIVLKIETMDGFEKLPLLLLEAMKAPNPLGVMIARGDLAVECGWERLADVQERIFDVCSAAHVPVIYATQVLESLVKSGMPTRAEIADVSYGRRASCIMLNKGKHVVEAVSTLDSILRVKPSQRRPAMDSICAI